MCLVLALSAVKKQKKNEKNKGVFVVFLKQCLLIQKQGFVLINFWVFV